MAFPQELFSLKQFVVWKMEPREVGGKPTKVPYNPRTGSKASASDKDTWATLDEAQRAITSGQYTGLGFEFAPPFCGIDLDNCRDAETGIIADWAIAIVNDFNSYTEVSPSRRGLHIFIKGALPGLGINRTVNGNKIEMYDKGRFFTLTGEHLSGTPLEIFERQFEIETLYHWVIENTTSKKPDEPPAERPNLTMSDDEVLTKCRTARNADKFNRLWAGDCSDYPDPDRPGGNHSAADLALCSILAFYTQDFDQIDRLFRNSGLNRQKWNRPDYRQRTISEALNKTEYYKAPDTTRVYFGDKKNGESADEFTEDSLNRSDTGNGIRLVRSYGRDLRYCFTWGKWLVWDGSRWKVDDNGAIERIAKETARGILVEAARCEDGDKRQALAKWAVASENCGKLDGMVKAARSEQGIPITIEDLDQNQYLLNVQNGTLDLLTGKLYEPRRTDLITRLAPVAYDPSASCPTFEKFLNTIFNGNQEIIYFVQNAIGYSLTGDTSEQKMLVCYGTGANGKSTLLELLNDLVGEYATTIATDSLLYKHQPNAISNDLAKLRGSRFVSCVETDEGRRLSESLIKQLTGGDKITARFLYQELFTFRPNFKIWMAVNHKPIINGTDHGIWRRICLIPFNVTIPDDDQDKDLPAKLRAELPGILNWALDGCLSWKRKGLGKAEAVTSATAEYKNEMDKLGAFIEERCNIGPTFEVGASEIYQTYKKWAEDNGIKYPYDSKKFKNILLEKGFGSKRAKYGVLFTGITLLRADEW